MKIFMNIHLVYACLAGFQTGSVMSLPQEGMHNGAMDKPNIQAAPTELNIFPAEMISPFFIEASWTRKKALLKMHANTCGRMKFCNQSLSENPIADIPCFKCHRCSCDEQCHKYGDCCVDRFVSINEKILQTKKDFKATITEDKGGFECFPYHPSPYGRSQQNTGQQESVFIVVKCPDLSSERQRRLCEDKGSYSLQNVALVTSMATNFTYRNIDCAHCHGDGNEIMFWKIEPRCTADIMSDDVTSSQELLQKAIDEPACGIYLKPPASSSLRSCKSPVVKSCPSYFIGSDRTQTNPALVRELCESEIYAPVTVGKTAYINVFCAVCHRETPWLSEYMCRLDSASGFAPLSLLINIRQPFKPVTSDRLLMRSHPAGHVSLEYMQDRLVCPDMEVYNPIQKSCSLPQCRKRTILSDVSTCNTVYATIAGQGYKWSYVMSADQDIPMQRKDDVFNQFIFHFRQNMLRNSISASFYIDLSIVVPDIGSADGRNASVSFSSFAVDGSFVSDNYIAVDKFENKLTSLLMGAWAWRTTDTVVTLVGNTSEQLEISVFHLFTRDLSDSDSNFKAIHLKRFDLSQTTYKIERLLESTRIRYAEFPYKPMLKCPFVQLNITTADVAASQGNVTITANDQRIIAKDAEIEIVERAIFVCSEALSRATRVITLLTSNGSNATISDDDDQWDNGLAVTSVVCAVVSLTGMVLTLVTYSLFPRLRTLPGLTLMALVTNLFLAQFLFQFGAASTVGIQYLCQIIGILIHYFWLAAFGWMAVCGYNMFVVFTNLLQSRSQVSRRMKKILRSAAFANSVPIPFIVGVITRNLIRSSNQSIGYGSSICYISQNIDKGIFFALPLGIMLLINIVCFVKTAISLREHSDVHRHSAQPERKNFAVLIKLSALMGFGWILGLVAAYVNHVAMWYVFIIVNGSQGIFIFVAYCLNRRIIDDYKHLLGMDKSENRKDRSPGNITTKTATTEITHLTNEVNLKNLNDLKIDRIKYSKN